MRCLHCGTTLSAFKKLTDSDFCSAGHRDAFYGEQQRLILERLKQSAIRFQRLGRAGPVDPASASAAAQAAKEEAPAPATLAAFLCVKLEPRQRSTPLRLFLSVFGYEATPVRPQRLPAAGTNTGFLSALIPDFPWPLYNSGLRYFADLAQPEFAEEFAYGRNFELKSIVRGAIQRCGLLPHAGPNVANILSERTLQLRIARPKPRIAMGWVRLARIRWTIVEMPAFGYRNFIELAPVELPLSAAILDASPIELTAAEGMPPSLRLRAKLAAQGVAFADRICRMGPRSGVPPPNIPLMRVVPVEFIPNALEPGRPGKSEELLPPGSVRGLPGISFDFAPPASRRLFRTGTRSEVTTGDMTGRPASNATEPLLSAPATPVMEFAAELAPCFVTRLLRIPSGSGVNASTATASNGTPEMAEAVRWQPAVTAIKLHGAGGFVPALVERPKVGVNSAIALWEGFVKALDVEPQAPEFAPDLYSVVSGAKPIFMNRMYRVRFELPAQDNDTLSHPIRTRHLPAPEHEPVMASLPKSAVAAAPSFLHGLYRMRPKGGKVTPPAANLIPCAALEPRSGLGAPYIVLSSVLRQWTTDAVEHEAMATTVSTLLILARSVQDRVPGCDRPAASGNRPNVPHWSMERISVAI